MKKKTKKNTQAKEIVWNVVNALLAGCLVFLGACSSGEITEKGIFLAVVASAIIAITKFYDYWKKEEGEYKTKIFNFIGA